MGNITFPLTTLRWPDDSEGSAEHFHYQRTASNTGEFVLQLRHGSAEQLVTVRSAVDLLPRLSEIQAAFQAWIRANGDRLTPRTVLEVLPTGNALNITSPDC